MAEVKAGRNTDLQFQIKSDFREENLRENGLTNILDYKSNTFFYFSNVQKCFYVQQYISKGETTEESETGKIQVRKTESFTFLLASSTVYSYIRDYGSKRS